jgi:hypothetical protein
MSLRLCIRELPPEPYLESIMLTTSLRFPLASWSLAKLSFPLLLIAQLLGCRDRPSADRQPTLSPSQFAPSPFTSPAALSSSPVPSNPPVAPPEERWVAPTTKPPAESRSAANPLGATKTQWIEFLERAARSRGKIPNRARLVKALDEPEHRWGDESKTLWAAECLALGFVDEDSDLEVLCRGEGNYEGLTLLVVDVDGDHANDYLVFGTWSLAAHQDELLLMYAPEGDALRKVHFDHGPPLDVGEQDSRMVSLGRPFLRKVGTKLVLEFTHLERYDPAGESLEYTAGDLARSVTTKRKYDFNAGHPVLLETRTEEWTAKNGKRVTVERASE